MRKEPGSVGNDAPLCLGGRGAAPPQHCGGPTGYRLMLKTPKDGRGDVHAGADGGRPGNVGGLRSRGAARDLLDLLKEVLPVAEATNSQTVREHLHAVAGRIEQELGEERQPRDFATVEAIAELPLPDGPMTVGIDGGYVRAAHKQGNFEVIAGR